MYNYTNKGGNNLPVPLWSTYTGCKKARAHHKARGDRASLVTFKATSWMSVLTGSVFALLRFHCIMHLPQYLSSANTSARWSGGRLRLHGAALGPAEGLLGGVSLSGIWICPALPPADVTAVVRADLSILEGNPPFSPSFLQMPVFIFGLICLTYTPWPGIWLFVICALWQWVLNGEFARCEFNVGFWRSCSKYDVVTDRNKWKYSNWVLVNQTLI